MTFLRSNLHHAPGRYPDAMCDDPKCFQERLANAAQKASCHPPEITPAATQVLPSWGLGSGGARKNHPKALFLVVPAAGLEPATL